MGKLLPGKTGPAAENARSIACAGRGCNARFKADRTLLLSLCACAPENTGRPGTGEPGMSRACESGSRGVGARESARQAQPGCRGQSGNAGKGAHRAGNAAAHVLALGLVQRVCRGRRVLDPSFRGTGGFAQWPLAYPACRASCAMPVACLSGNQALRTALTAHCLSRAQASAACRCWQRDSCAAPLSLLQAGPPGQPLQSLRGMRTRIAEYCWRLCCRQLALYGQRGCTLVFLLPWQVLRCHDGTAGTAGSAAQRDGSEPAAGPVHPPGSLYGHWQHGQHGQGVPWLPVMVRMAPAGGAGR